MPKFILTYLVSIEGNKQQDIATVGVSSPTSDHQPNRARRQVEDHYRQKYPGKSVAAVLQQKKAATNDEYLKASAGFIEIKPRKK